MDDFLRAGLNRVLENVKLDSSGRPNIVGDVVGGKKALDVRVGNYTVTVVNRLAEGGFGFVDLVVDGLTKREYVMKRCNVELEESRVTAQREINYLQQFRGPYVVDLLAFEITSRKEALLLLEFCPNGHLLHRLNERNGHVLSVKSIFNIFNQLLSPIIQMHSSDPPVTHRDLKLENILFGQDGRVRLCDFGSCVEGHIQVNTPSDRSAEEERLGKSTTQMYRAPEMVDLYMRNSLTEKTDIWALGCIFYALCFLLHPFRDAGSLGILGGKYTIPQSTLSQLVQGAVEGTAENIQTLISRMIDIDPEARPSAAQLSSAIEALLAGQPLPDLPLSEEALQCRATRVANESRRLKQTPKKPPVQVHHEPRGAVQLDPNSVAAKRLAARKPGTASSGSISSPSTPSSSAVNSRNQSPAPFVDLIDTFGTTPSREQVSGSHSKPTSGGTLVDFDSDPFGLSGNTAAGSSQVVSSSDWDFRTTSTPANTSGQNNDAFFAFGDAKGIEVSSRGAQDDVFSWDAFGESLPAASTASASAAPSQPADSDPFGVFGDDNDLPKVSYFDKQSELANMSTKASAADHFKRSKSLDVYRMDSSATMFSDLSSPNNGSPFGSMDSQSPFNSTGGGQAVDLLDLSSLPEPPSQQHLPVFSSAMAGNMPPYPPFPSGRSNMPIYRQQLSVPVMPYNANNMAAMRHFASTPNTSRTVGPKPFPDNNQTNFAYNRK